MSNKKDGWNFPVKKSRDKRSKDKKTINETIAKMEEKLEELKAIAEGTNDVSSLVARGIEITLELESVKELYKEQDAIIEELLETGETQFEHEGTTLTLVDRFVEKNKQWKSVPFSRFTIEVTTHK